MATCIPHLSVFQLYWSVSSGGTRSGAASAVGGWGDHRGSPLRGEEALLVRERASPSSTGARARGPRRLWPASPSCSARRVSSDRGGAHRDAPAHVLGSRVLSKQAGRGSSVRGPCSDCGQLETGNSPPATGSPTFTALAAQPANKLKFSVKVLFYCS